MKIIDFMRELYDTTENTPAFYEKTCDTFKTGDPEAEITKIATAMFATPQVIRDASAWGANLLVVHEPTFYDHWDDLSGLETLPEPRKSLVKAKLELIRNSGLTIYRYHDHPHRRKEDVIGAGELKYWGLKGVWHYGNPSGTRNIFELEFPMPVMLLAETLEKNLKIQHIRIAGSTKTLCKKLALKFGAPGNPEKSLLDCDVILTGEICEWRDCEFVRDYADLLGERSILVMGHITSEREGMRLLADMIAERHPEYETRYFECGEVYSYTR